MNKIRHTGIVTTNLNKSLIFWNKYLKFKIYKQADEKGKLIDKIMLYKNVKVKTVKLKDSNGSIIEILSFIPPLHCFTFSRDAMIHPLICLQLYYQFE